MKTKIPKLVPEAEAAGLSIPACLIDKQLSIGDLEQIKAMDDLELQMDEMKKIKEAKGNGDLNLYVVTVEVTGEFTDEVWASCEEEAKEKIQDDFTLSEMVSWGDVELYYTATKKQPQVKK